MASPDLVRARLRGPALDDLVHMIMDDLLEHPVEDLVDPAWIAPRLVDALRAAARDPKTEERIRAELGRIREAVGKGDDIQRSKVGSHLPAEIQATLNDLVGQPYTLDREFLTRVLDHAAFKELLRGTLHDALVRFGHRLRSLAPDPARLPGLGGLPGGLRPPGYSTLKAMAAMSSGVASLMGAEIERQVEQRATEFVNQALGGMLGQVAEYLADPARAPEMASWRRHGLDVVLDTEVRIWTRELSHLDPDALANMLTRGLRALAQREGLETEIHSLLGSALRSLESRNLGAILDRAGMRATWRQDAAPALRAWLDSLFGTEAFERWLIALLQD